MARWSDGYWSSSDGLRLHYRDYAGDAARPPIVCIPGLTRNVRDFEGVAERLAGRRRLICADLRGRGGSEQCKDPMRYVPAVYVEDMEALIAELGLARFVLFGTSLGGLITMLLAQRDSTRIAAALLNDIEFSTQRIADLVGAVKAYTYMDQAPLQEVDLHKGLENTLKVLNHKLKNVTVTRRYDCDLPLVLARGGELNQIWTNLIDNAIDAMGGAGTITLITRCENSFAMVEIADDGPGIPPEVRDRIFDPFFTTKPVGEGTGLGLDVAWRIVVTNHGGELRVASEPGDTRFDVLLPAP